MKTPLIEAIAADTRGSEVSNTEMQMIFGRCNRVQAFATNGKKWAEAEANHVYQKFPYTTQMQYIYC